jgi:hypothetical protein
MPLIDKIQELNESRAKTAMLEAEVAKELKEGLSSLPAQYGFEKPRDFCEAVLKACGKRLPRAAKTEKATGGRMSADQKAKAEKLLREGYKSSIVADQLALSKGAIDTLKARLGLTKKREPKAA